MPNGDFIDEKRGHKVGAWSKSYKLLDNQTATGTGKWIDVSLFPRLSIHVYGTFNATMKVMVSNDPSIVDATDGIQVGADITAPGFIALELPARWIKLKPTAFTSGNIYANLHGLSP
ncbi:MAG: hypothetical protein K2W95_15680 [Candidatus Obscuribacterales bacterium]|nr:hypothetical protein [Candidatus Obscuribacterales bacterium]